MKRQIPVLLLCLALLLSACGGTLPAGTEASAPPPREEPPPAPEEPAVPEEPPPPEPTTATLAVCGDAMSHMPITNDAWNGERYDYARIMAAARPYVETADYAVVNLETTLSGGPPYSGYPAFNITAFLQIQVLCLLSNESPKSLLSAHTCRSTQAGNLTRRR